MIKSNINSDDKYLLAIKQKKMNKYVTPVMFQYVNIMHAIVEKLICNSRKKSFTYRSILFHACLVFYQSILTSQDKHIGILYAYQY